MTSERTADASYADLPRRPFPGGGGKPADGELRIAVDKQPYAQIIGHAMQDPEVELCGVLVGELLRDDHGPYVHVTDSIRGEQAREEGASVTFTHETWNHINQQMDRRFPDRRIVGWYHTHGGFGIFLSEMDTFVHRNFFSEPYHLAYVYDPLAGTEGFFRMEQAKVLRESRYWLAGRAREVRYELPETEAGGGEDAGVAAAVRSLQRAVDALQQATLARPQEGASLPLLLGLGVLLLLMFALLFPSSSGGGSAARAILPIYEDTSGRVYGVKVIPVEQDSGGWIAAYRDAKGNRYYGVKLEPVEGSGLPLLRLPDKGAAGSKKPGSTGTPQPQPGPDAEQKGRPNLWIVLGAILGVAGLAIGLLFAVVLWIRRRGKR